MSFISTRKSPHSVVFAWLAAGGIILFTVPAGGDDSCTPLGPYAHWEGQLRIPGSIIATAPGHLFALSPDGNGGCILRTFDLGDRASPVLTDSLCFAGPDTTRIVPGLIACRGDRLCVTFLLEPPGPPPEPPPPFAALIRSTASDFGEAAVDTVVPGTSLYVFDVVTPAHPVLVDTLGFSVELTGLLIADRELILASADHIHRIDPAQTSSCAPAQTVSVPGVLGHAMVDAGTAIVVGTESTMVSLAWGPGDSLSVRGLAAAAGRLRDLARLGPHIVAMTDTVVQIMDIGPSFDLRAIGSLPVLYPSTLAVGLDGNRLYLSGGHQVDVVDVSSPSAPRMLHSLRCTHSAVFLCAMEVMGDMMLLQSTHSVEILRLSGDACFPVALGEVEAESGEYFHDVDIEGTYAFAAVGRRLMVIDIMDPSAPQPVALSDPFDLDYRGLVVHDGYAYVCPLWDEDVRGIQVFDVRDPRTPAFVGEIAVPLSRNLAASGSWIYATSYWGLLSVDVSNPAQAVVVDTLAVSALFGDVAMAGDRVFVMTPGAVQEVDVSRPDSMRAGGRCEVEGWQLNGISAHGDEVYVVGEDPWSGEGVFMVLDAATRGVLVPLGILELPWGVKAVDVDRMYAFAQGFIIDVSDGRNPQIVAGDSRVANTWDGGRGVRAANGLYLAVDWFAEAGGSLQRSVLSIFPGCRRLAPCREARLDAACTADGVWLECAVPSGMACVLLERRPEGHAEWQVVERFYPETSDAWSAGVLDAHPVPGPVHFRMVGTSRDGGTAVLAQAVADCPRLPRPWLSVSPNPMRVSSRVEFALEAGAEVEVSIFDAMGRRVRSLERESLPVGPHHVVWNGCDENREPVASGLYLVRVKAGDRHGLAKILVVR